MAEHVHQITAALPRGRASRRCRRNAVAEEQQIPTHHAETDVVGKAQLGLAIDDLHGRQLHDIGVDRVGVRPRHAAIGRVRHGRIEIASVARDAFVQRAPEIVGRPAADAVVRIGRDVGRVDRAEAAFHREAAGERGAARRGVASGAIGRLGQIFPARDDPLRRVRHLQRAAAVAAQDVDRDEASEHDRADARGRHGEPDQPPCRRMPDAEAPCAHAPSRVRPGVVKMRSRTAW